MVKVWVTKVIEQDGYLGVEVPGDLLKSLGWKPNQLLEWKAEKSGDVVISKTNIISGE